MEFSFLQCATLQAVKGAYSPVTDREIYDSQITATDTEAKLLVEYFKRTGEGIYVGNVNSNRDAARKQFRLFPSGDRISLNLVYPKPNKTELRLYLSSRAGFMPEKGRCLVFVHFQAGWRVVDWGVTGIAVANGQREGALGTGGTAAKG